MRYASGRKGFLGEFVDNLRQEFSKNQEMKENIKKFREEAKRLEESDALQQARRKYVRTLAGLIYIIYIKINIKLIIFNSFSRILMLFLKNF